MMMRGHK